MGRNLPSKPNVDNFADVAKSPAVNILAEYSGLSYRRFCISLVILEMIMMIVNIVFQTSVGWWHTWSFSADYENPEVFYPILLMPLRAISWLDVGFSILFLLSCSMALGGLLKDHEELLKCCIRTILPLLIWRLLVVIFYICVAVLRHRELFLLYYGTIALTGYIIVWLIAIPVDVILFIALRTQYKRYKLGIGHTLQEILSEK